MKPISSRPLRAALALLLSFGLAGAQAQTPAYPSKTIRLIAANPPGGSSDFIARHLAQGLAAELGQSVVVENRGGANGMIAAQMTANAPPDGHVLLLATISVMSLNPVIFTKVPYDSLTGFAPISMVTTQPLALVVNANHPAKNFQELIDMARAKPGVLNFGSTAASAALPFAHLQSLSGMKMTSIPYAGAGPGMNAILGGQVDCIFITLGAVYQHMQAKKVRALAVTSPQRAPLLPDVPAIAELYPGFEASQWNGVATAAGTPREVINRLNQAVIKTMSSPELKAQFAKEGTQVVTSSPEQFGEQIRVELERWKKVARENGIQPITQ